MAQASFSRLVEQLVVCPTCGRRLEMQKGASILQCTDLYHGRFVIREASDGYSVEYQPKKRAFQ